MDFAFGIFMLTGAWVWLCLALWIIITFAAIEKESGTGALFWLAVFLIILHTGGVVNVFSTLFANPLTVCIAAIAYFVVGTFWTMAKFKMYVRKERIRLNEELAKGRHANLSISDLSYDLRVETNKSNILRWAAWWPFSMVWTVIRDVVRDIFDWIVTDVIGKVLNQISQSEIDKIDKPKK